MSTTLSRWRDNLFAPFEVGSGLFPFVSPDIRIEQVIEDGHFVVRAEIPGVDPQRDIDISVDHGSLSIRAERSEEKRDKTHSEFHYGQLVRTVLLPNAAKEQSATAKYTHGVLEISFAMGEAPESGRHIPIEVAHGGTRELGGKAKK
jgi:HSP20 family molecular chaperone IbpA